MSLQRNLGNASILFPCCHWTSCYELFSNFLILVCETSWKTHCCDSAVLRLFFSVPHCSNCLLSFHSELSFSEVLKLLDNPVPSHDFWKFCFWIQRKLLCSSLEVSLEVLEGLQTQYFQIEVQLNSLCRLSNLLFFYWEAMHDMKLSLGPKR